MRIVPTSRRLLAALLVTSAGLLPARPADLQTRASLLLSHETGRPGETITAAVRLQMAKGWHTYWRNPGESGMATSIQWELPPGVTAGDILWPPPERHVAADMTTYVYHGDVLLLVPLNLATSLKPGQLSLKATVEWLECEVACVPGTSQLEAALNVGEASKPSGAAELINKWRSQIPQPAPALQLESRWEPASTSDTASLLLTGREPADFAPNDFYPYPSDDFAVAPAVNARQVDAGKFSFAKEVKRFGDAFPPRIHGILIQTDSAGKPLRAVEATLNPVGAPPGAAASVKPAEGAGNTSPGPQRSLLVMLALAFLGGLILNIMPCVLPVIALKILGFVQQSQEAPDRVKKLGLMYGGGVMVSFLAMALVVVAVQQAGGNASWGMQMQNPFFRIALLLIVLLVALNLFGVFEVTLGSSAMGTAARLSAREGSTGAFFNGVLATALGTSCTAPILAIAIGFAFTQPSWVVLAMFLTIGLGLAFPYVLLSWNPRWLRLLPKPGPWMQKFKVAMGFPMIGTAVWIFEFTAPSYGPGGVLWLGMFLAVVAFAAWIWGELGQRQAGGGRLAAGLSALALLGAAYFFILEGQLHWRTPVGNSTSTSYVKDSPDGLEWQPWSHAAVEAARKRGSVVLVDFTAKWCPNCRSNKKFAIDIPRVRERVRELKATVFRGDYTDRDPRITEELRKYKRAGVPLVLVFPPDPDRPALVLPELLTPSIVLDALEEASRAPARSSPPQAT